MKRLLFAACCLCLLNGCADPIRNVEQLKRPLTIAAISPAYDVTLVGADGKVVTLDRDYFRANVFRILKPGDVVGR